MSFGRVCLSVLLALTLTGCLFPPSPPVHYYVLAAPPENLPLLGGGGLGDPGVSPRVGPRVGILPITMPGYLLRPQMVVRQDDSVDIRMEDFHRWGEDLGSGIARVLSVAMTNDLASVQGVVLPLRTGAPVDLRLQVDVRRFEGYPGESAALEAVWSIQRAGIPVREGHFLQQAPAGPDLTSLVKAQSDLLLRFAEELATAAMAVHNAD